ncbi:MAG: 16S rRNA (guanine(527)-N(7))-methyltransferase RsmG [Rhodospirillaceae bacterium TMED8]|nr:MAG: 16S rRNA (guanine(527)-N(7))-methyltransferase RsmG [Rhodospirillaceae bacterium TMED8]
MQGWRTNNQSREKLLARLGKSVNQDPLSAADFQRLMGASQSVMVNLKTYLDSLRCWQEKINLVGSSTLRDPWRRHFLDSAQLLHLMPGRFCSLIDLGSGAGFPGMVLGIMNHSGRGCEFECGVVSLIDSDQRKSIFLREVSRLTKAHVSVHSARIESFTGPKADIVTARACAPLERLLPLANRVLSPRGRCFFLKGDGVQAELTVALKDWKMDVICHNSISDKRGIILEVSNLVRHIHS